MAYFEDRNKKDRIVLREAIPLPIPLCISIEPADACNFRCLMCFHGQKEWRQYNPHPVIMDMDLFYKCIDDIKEWTSKIESSIKLMKLYSLGEPLLNPFIGEMVRIIKEKDICDSLEITSNSSLLTKDTAEKFVNNQLDIYRASVYSIYEDNNRRITRNNSFTVEQIADNIRYMKEYRDQKGLSKPFISAKMIDSYTVENDDFLSLYSQIADEAYIDRFTESSDGNELMKRYYQSHYQDALNDTNRRVYAERKCCRYPFTHMTIKADGRVVVCCNDWQDATIIGRVQNNSLEDIWNSEELYEFRKMMLTTKGTANPLCRVCEIPMVSVCPEDDIDSVSVERL